MTTRQLRLDRRSIVIASLAVLVAVILAGCGLYSRWGGIEPPEDAIPVPSVRATYSEGTATIDADQAGANTVVQLDRVGPSSQLLSMYGASANWRSNDGWGLTVSAFDPGEFGGFGGGTTADITIQRVNGLDVWVAGGYYQPGRCIVDADEISETALSGSATCRGLRWIDGMAAGTGFGLGGPAYIEGQEPFDAEITFHAQP